MALRTGARTDQVAAAMIKLLCPVILAFAAVTMAGCALSPTPSARREAVARRIADDAQAFNEAYGQAVAGQILLNIMRGRDRLPRHYLAMTGINDSPSLRVQESANIGAIPLGRGDANWGFGSVGVQRETQSRPTYSIQPFSADTLTRTAFQPIAPYVFAHYWANGWPRDLLLLLLVDRLSVSGPQGGGDYDNEANNIANNCSDDVRSSGCDFVHRLRGMMADLDANPIAPQRATGIGVCGLVEAHAPARPVRAVAPEAGQECSPRFVIGATTYELHLRSLDDVVYYVGELLRAGTMTAGNGAIEAQIDVRAAGLRGGGRGVPLFRVLPDHLAHAPLYAASISYAGERYRAGPAIGRSCAAATDTGLCRDDADNGDRSSSVLSLLAELMALNQSPDAIRAPNRLFAE